MKAALYARVSSRESQERQDPEVQFIRLREFAHLREFTETVEFVDHASGADPNRPGLVALLEAARRGEFKAVIIIRIDRIMRSTMHLLEVVKSLDTWGVSLICVDQPIETETAMGRMVLAFLAAIAEFERELIVERTLDGLAKARKEGRIGGRRRRKIDLVRLRDMRGEGLSWAQCSKDLGVPESTLRGAAKKEGWDCI
jgi:DNA invertase Pin-like site-specific DNA recombinase